MFVRPGHYRKGFIIFSALFLYLSSSSVSHAQVDCIKTKQSIDDLCDGDSIRKFACSNSREDYAKWCQPSSTTAKSPPFAPRKEHGTMCFITGWKAIEDQGGGKYPNYVYESAPFAGSKTALKTYASRFAMYINSKYRLDEGRSVGLNLRKAFCYYRSLNSNRQDYLAKINQDGGVTSIDEVPTDWTPSHH